MPDRSSDWIKQAERDIEKAKLDAQWGYYEWACFTSQQAAEKAVKAVFQKLNAETWGHGIKPLLENLPSEVQGDLIDAARRLDKFYIPTRYPNGLPSGIPHEEEAEQAIKDAEAIYEWCKGKIFKS